MNGWMIPISVMLPPEVIEAIDKKRKGTPRSTYLRQIIERDVYGSNTGKKE